MIDVNFPQDFYLDDVGVWRLKKEKLAELEKPKQMTNEEYMKSLSTEMFAVAIYNAIMQGAVRINCDITLENKSGTELKEAIYEWLQEVHKG